MGTLTKSIVLEKEKHQSIRRNLWNAIVRQQQLSPRETLVPIIQLNSKIIDPQVSRRRGKSNILWIDDKGVFAQGFLFFFFAFFFLTELCLNVWLSIHERNSLIFFISKWTKLKCIHTGPANCISKEYVNSKWYDDHVPRLNLHLLLSWK